MRAHLSTSAELLRERAEDLLQARCVARRHQQGEVGVERTTVLLEPLVSRVLDLLGVVVHDELRLAQLRKARAGPCES